MTSTIYLQKQLIVCINCVHIKIKKNQKRQQILTILLLLLLFFYYYNWYVLIFLQSNSLVTMAWNMSC